MSERRTHYGVTFAVLATAALAFSLLQSLIIPAIPQLEHTLHTTESGASWLLTAYLLTRQSPRRCWGGWATPSARRRSSSPCSSP